MVATPPFSLRPEGETLGVGQGVRVMLMSYDS